LVGLANWGGIEYWGEFQGWPTKCWNDSFFNHALEPNPQAYLIESIFTDKPLVHIGVVESEAESHLWNDVVVGRNYISSHWNREEVRKYDLYTYTNADEFTSKSMHLAIVGIEVRWPEMPVAFADC
jgi:beta-galactosidase